MDRLGAFVRQIQPKYDDDSIDRLNYYYTVWLILAFCLTIGAKQYVGEPIQCWVPAQFTGAWEQYAENYCFVENTYYVSWNESIPDEIQTRENRELAYYQWVPFVLALQALLFFFPHSIWNMLNPQSGMNISQILSTASDAKNINGEARKSSVQVIASHLYASTTFRKRVGRGSNPLAWFFSCGKPKGIFMTFMYLVTKIMYIANVIGQLFILERFIGSDSQLWGANILHTLNKGSDWRTHGLFPRTTMCDFEVRSVGDHKRVTIQCVLMINMFNEKIYIFLWFWFIMVAILNICNFVWWAYLGLSRGSRISFVQKYYGLTRAGDIPLSQKANFEVSLGRGEKERVAKFVRSKLRPDAVFVLRIIAANAGDLITTEIVRELYARYQNDRQIEDTSL